MAVGKQSVPNIDYRVVALVPGVLSIRNEDIEPHFGNAMQQTGERAGGKRAASGMVTVRSRSQKESVSSYHIFSIILIISRINFVYNCKKEKEERRGKESAS